MEQLVKKHYNRVFSYCMAILMNRESALDATQEVFFKIQDRLRRGEPVKHHRAWILTVARNHCFDILRREKHFSTNEILCEYLPSPDIDPLTRTINRESIDQLYAALQRISREMRMLIVLRDLQGLAYREIGDQLEMNVKEVKWKLHRARKMLTEQLGDMYDP